MAVVLAVVIGVLYGVALYLLLRRSLAQVILGLAILTNATNLLIFTVAGPVRVRPAIVAPNAEQLTPPFADPVPITGPRRPEARRVSARNDGRAQVSGRTALAAVSAGG